MTIETCNERCKQSSRLNDYMIMNPSNNIDNVSDCISVPGMMCTSLNVKQVGSVDTETILLRGVQSVGVEPSQVTLTGKGSHKDNTITTDPFSFIGQTTRLSKSCNGEYDLMGRFEAPYPIPIENLPSMDNSTLVGTNSRNLAKYGKK